MDIAPYVILITLCISIIIARKINKSDIITIDGIFAAIGFLLGLSVTSLNLIYSNNYLITIGPLMTIACLLYLRFRNKFLTERNNLSLGVNSLKLINILYWICIIVALFTYNNSTPYYRHPIFFVSISVGITMLGLEILGSTYKGNIHIFHSILKILLISLIIRNSAYFISTYPVGSDPWSHAEIIKDMTIYGTSNLQQIHAYYSNYPLMHLQASITILIANINILESMSIIGTILTLSTIFVYLFVKKITNDVNLALFSMLLLNFADFHIQWSTQVIAMTFGIAIYTVLLYLIVTNENKSPIRNTFLILILFMLTWTHTVTSFIALTSIVSLYFGSIMYNVIYLRKMSGNKIYSITFCMLFAVMLLLHWMDPQYPFFDKIIIGVTGSLSAEASFLGREATISDESVLNSVLNIVGFLMYIFFGVIGSLFTLSSKYVDMKKVSLIFMLVVLYFVFFAFPVMGMRDIMPNRWPAFIYVSFVPFVGIGLVQSTNLLKNKQAKLVLIILILFVSSFFMITNSSSNMDSPIYGKDINRELIWTQSEMTLFGKAASLYSGRIITDLQTESRPFEIYFKRTASVYHLTEDNQIDWSFMDNNLIIWRKKSLTRPLQVQGYRNPHMLLGSEFKDHLDENYDCVFDTGGARAYI